jgi:hypothetical protein
LFNSVTPPHYNNHILKAGSSNWRPPNTTRPSPSAKVHTMPCGKFISANAGSLRCPGSTTLQTFPSYHLLSEDSSVHGDGMAFSASFTSLPAIGKAKRAPLICPSDSMGLKGTPNELKKWSEISLNSLRCQAIGFQRAFLFRCHRMSVSTDLRMNARQRSQCAEHVDLSRSKKH